MIKESTYITLKIKYLIILTLSIISYSAFGQIFGGEQNPLSVNWRQINTSGFKLIYPAELEKEAQRMANTIPHIFPFDGASLGVHKTTLPILFQNRGVIANGFVELAPKKSEFFSTPPQQFDSQDWLNNLAVHELRHAAQFDKLTRGRPYPFPEEIYFAWMGASIPLWFFEGDAVSTETSLTHSGRGRIPSWIMPFRTSLLEGKNLSYSKADFGSNKDVTPGYYQLGYLMVSNIREEFGAAIFDSLLTDIRNRPFRLYPFSKSLKKYTGKGSEEWFEYTKAKLKKEWQLQDKKTVSKNYIPLNKPTRYATDYFLPTRLPNGQILALKQSKTETAHFVLIDHNKKETNLFGIGYQEQPWFSYANGILVWDEIRYDPRFRQRSYSVICTYNMTSRRINKLSSKSRLFSPAVSPDGQRITAVKIDLSNRSNLVEINALNGTLIYTYPNPDNLILQTPSYDATGKLIAYVSVSEKGKALWIADKKGKRTKIINETRQQLSRPIFISKGIAFNAHYSGLDDIYYIDLNSKKISALSASKYGALNASPVKGTNRIIFNNYNLFGYEIAETTIDPVKVKKDNFVYFGAAAEKQEHTGSVFSNIPDSTYISKPYRKLGHLVNFHSIVPIIEDEYTGGLQLKSNNLLNTFDLFTGINYHRDLKRFEYNAGFSLKSFYPIINATYINRPVRTFYSTSKHIKQGDWRENYIELNAQLPINLTALNQNYDLSLNVGTSYTKRYMPQNLPENFITTLSFPMQYSFTFSHNIFQAERDIAPRWGQILRLNYIHQPFDKQLPGSLFAVGTFFYFPGLAKNHSFLANFNYQDATGIRQYSNLINTVYGYYNIPARSELTNTLLLNYRFPIAFPDWELGPMAYIRNFRGGLFCHYENIGAETNLTAPKTYGLELHSSLNLLRYSPVLDVGARIVFVNKLYHQNPILEFSINYTL